MTAPRVPVVCPRCPWRGNRKHGEQWYGTCPKCRAWVRRCYVMNQRRVEKARAQLAVSTP
jgi:predicted ATP-dependent serine protease